jgi:hypothetical protein
MTVLFAWTLGLMAFSWFLALVPALIYPCICWAYWLTIKHKRAVINQILGTNQARELYKRAYAPTAEPQHDPFSTLFGVTYHLPSYLMAIGLNMFFVFLGVQASLAYYELPTIFPEQYAAALRGAPLSMVAGLAGAYIWGVYETLRRYWSAELSSISLHFIWVRLMLFAVFGPVVEAVVKAEFAVLVAFAAAFLPLEVLVGFFGSQARQRLNIEAGQGEKPTLEKLQGCTRAVIDRLSDEGIDSVSRLAYADPVRLLLRTNFEWKVILDMVDQAALYIYIGDKIDQLRPLGIRSGMELTDTFDLIESDDLTPEEGRVLLSSIAQKLGMDELATRNLMFAIEGDAHFQFVRELWAKGSASHVAAAADEPGASQEDAGLPSGPEPNGTPPTSDARGDAT